MAEYSKEGYGLREAALPLMMINGALGIVVND
jgi:hypothetical protein